jgi:hypothetical protein
MAKLTQKSLEKEELNLLREQMLRPEELFLLQYLKNSNRTASQKLQEVYGFDKQAVEE